MKYRNNISTPEKFCIVDLDESFKVYVYDKRQRSLKGQLMSCKSTDNIDVFVSCESRNPSQ